MKNKIQIDIAKKWNMKFSYLVHVFKTDQIVYFGKLFQEEKTWGTHLVNENTQKFSIETGNSMVLQ